MTVRLSKPVRGLLVFTVAFWALGSVFSASIIKSHQMDEETPAGGKHSTLVQTSAQSRTFEQARQYYAEGDYERAEPLLLAEINAHEAGDKKELRSLVLFLAGFYRDWGKHQESQKYYRRVIEIDADTDLAAEGLDLNNLALAYFMHAQSLEPSGDRQKLYDKSEELYRRALACPISESTRKLVNANLAVLLSEENRFAEATHIKRQ